MTQRQPILVLAATELEIRDLLAAAGGAPPSGDPVPTAHGKLGPFDLVAAITGVGKSNAGFAAGWILAGPIRFSGVVNIGCAGGYPGTMVAVGDVILADREVLADEGVAAGDAFLDLREISLPALAGERPIYNEVPIRPPFRLSPRGLSLLSEAMGFPVRAGPLATVSAGSGTEGGALRIARRWKALAESMEGGAIALAALRAGLPFLEARGISNLAGPRDRASWDIAGAARRAAAVVVKILEGADHWEEPVEEEER